MDADEEFSPVNSEGGGKVGICERARFQNIAFEVMSRYGLDTGKFRPKYTTGGFDSKGSSRHNDGTSREFLMYPSQTIPGISFERWRDYYTDTGETIFVRWTVEGQKQPVIKRLERLVSRGPQVVEI